MGERYAAGLEMAEWADSLGFANIWLLEHHGSPDGYIPSPLSVIAAMAARTTNVRLIVTALIAPFYDPLRLAEDICVVDNLSNGRLGFILGAGYVHEEFEMFGVPMKERPKRVTEVVKTLQGAFSGKPFEYRGRTVHVTPPPFQPGGPEIVMGGSSEGAARRAARLGVGFYPTMPEFWEPYRDEMLKLGSTDPGPRSLRSHTAGIAHLLQQNRFSGTSGLSGKTVITALARDAERGWAQLAPYFLHDTNAYARWQAQDNTHFRETHDTDALRAAGVYRVLTPDEMVAELAAAESPSAMFHPMCGGVPPELAWESLRLLEREVLPALNLPERSGAG